MGDYSDYYENRQTDEQVTEKKKTPQTRAEQPPKPKKLKFTFKEQREFEGIDEEIAKLESKIDSCTKEIAASSSDYIRLQEHMAEKEKLEAELEEKTERWVYLQELSEKIEEQNNSKTN